MHSRRPIKDRFRTLLPLLAVLSVLAAGLLPGVHAAIGCRHAEHAAAVAAHAGHLSDAGADRSAAPTPRDSDDDDCPICLLIATSQHLGTGLVLPPAPLLALARTANTAPIPEPPALPAHSHAPCITRGPPAAA